MLFSATFPNEARQLAKIYLSPNHVRIRVGRIGSSHRNIKQTVSLFPIRPILTNIAR